MTGIQNQMGYVPKYFGVRLNHEYNIKGLVENSFESHNYLPSMRVWSKTDILVNYVKDKAEKNSKTGPSGVIKPGG